MRLFWRRRALPALTPSPSPVPDAMEPKPPPEPVRVEIGEIPVDVKAGYCCGLLVWYGLFPDGSCCCEYAVHQSFDEALQCARQRVAAGFVMREQS